MNTTTTRAAMPQPDVLVLGAGLTGLTAALMLAAAGLSVSVLERDPAPPPDPAHAWTDWDRPGVAHLRQPHLMLPRWHQETARELPALLEALDRAGATPVNTLHLQPATLTHSWQPGDERYATLAARRPLIEATLALLAAGHPLVTITRGVRITGLLLATGPRTTPVVTGVDTAGGTVRARFVVDATGRHTPAPGWLRALGLPGPHETRDPGGFAYYSRHFRAAGPLPELAPGGVLTHQRSLSALALPGGGDAFSVVLAVDAADHAQRGLRDERAWTALAQRIPTVAPWLARSEPVSQVLPFAGLADVVRDYTAAGGPVVGGLLALGDAQAATTPLLGRGSSLGALGARVLRHALTGSDQDVTATTGRFWANYAHTVTPWVRATQHFSRHRLAELAAEAAGTPYQPDDPSWAMVLALRAGAALDPVLARASGRIAGLLDPPDMVLGDPVVQARLRSHLTDAVRG